MSNQRSVVPTGNWQDMANQNIMKQNVGEEKPRSGMQLMSFNDKNGLVSYLATPEAQMRQMQEL